MVTNVFKQRVIDKLKEQENNSGLSSARFAVKIGINQAQWSRLKKGEMEGVLADSKFVTLARENGVTLGDKFEPKTVKTASFEYIYSLLDTCQKQSICVLFVDLPDIGKTHTGKYFCRNNKNAIYIDCSRVKTKQLFIRKLAQELGVNHTQKYSDVFEDLIFYMNSMPNLIVFLDEAGDLKYDAFLESKALWNATEGNVGWFMTGADGLKAKFERAINGKKVGYGELFRRYGSTYRKVSPDNKQEAEAFKREQVFLVAQANAPKGTDIQKLVTASKFSLTNVLNIIRVMNQQNQQN